jgi:hypothetical protein
MGPSACLNALKGKAVPLTGLDKPLGLQEVEPSRISKKSGHEGHKVIENKMCVLIFSTNIVRNIYQSKKNSARYHHKCTQVFT